MVLDRSIAPPIIPITKLHIPEVESYVLANGLRVYAINAGTQDILKVEIIHPAGRSNEVAPLASKLYAGTVKEGTKSKNSSQIATLVDYYGATISSRSGMDSASLTLYCLHKHLESVLPVFIDVVANPTFPEDEIEKFKKRSAERLAVQLAKNDVQAYRKITEMIFGENHAYGYNSYPESFEELTQGLALKQYNEKILTEDSFVIISGKITLDCSQTINDQLSQLPISKSSTPSGLFVESSDIMTYTDKGTNDYQTAIRIGKKLFNRDHKDFVGCYMMNTLFGGYFGSRLMSSIREEKGYTYGIFSMIDTMRYDGYFYISTEVANEYVQPTLEAIKEEITILQNERTDEEEMQMVKNYVMGSFMTTVDGPFKTSEVLKTLVIADLDFDYLHDFLDQIQSVSALEIQDLANKHLNIDSMYQVTVGDNPRLID